jgi:putative spermidine/putrescine transport system substrate-binding protein
MEKVDMLNRRQILAGGARIAIASTLGALVRPAAAETRALTFVSWGGAASAMEDAAFLKPYFDKAGGIYVSASPTETAKLKAMVEAGKVDWDLVDEDGASTWRGGEEGFLEKLDMAKIPNAKALASGWVTPYGIVTATGASVIAWSKQAFPNGGPEKWADFWDLKRFPGKRGMYKGFYWNYELAMLAEGLTRDEIYPVTDEKADMAFKKLDELKPNVQVWWSAGPQPAQTLSSGEVTLSSAWSGRVLAAIRDGAPIGYTYNQAIAWGNWWVIPKGTPYLELAHKVLTDALSVEAQTRLLKIDVYGPVLEAAAAKADATTRSHFVMAPEYAKNILILNEGEGAKYSVKYEERWNQFLLG